MMTVQQTTAAMTTDTMDAAVTDDTAVAKALRHSTTPSFFRKHKNQDENK